MQLETERLLLREFQEEDWQTVAGFSESPEASRYLLDHQKTPFYAFDFVTGSIAHAGCEPRIHFGLGIVLKESGQLIGDVALTLPQVGSAHAHIGWNLDRQFWGKGYTTEAMRVLVALAFERCGVEHLAAYCFADNAASRRVMEKLGMQLQSRGRWRQWLLALAYWETRSIVRYSLSKRQWAEQSSAV